MTNTAKVLILVLVAVVLGAVSASALGVLDLPLGPVNGILAGDDAAESTDGSTPTIDAGSGPEGTGPTDAAGAAAGATGATGAAGATGAPGAAGATGATGAAAGGLDPVTGAPTTGAGATGAAPGAAGAAGTDPSAAGAVPGATGAAAGAVPGAAGAAGSAAATAAAGPSRATTDATNSGNSPEALRIAAEIAGVLQQATITAAVDATLAPAQGGVGAPGAVVQYRKRVTAAIVRIALTDPASGTQWTSATKPVRTKLVQGFLTRLKTNYPSAAARSVTVVDASGTVLAIGDAAAAGAGTVKLY